MTVEWERTHQAQVERRDRAARERDARDLRALALVDEGVPQRKIAKMVGCAQSHVSDLLKASRETE